MQTSLASGHGAEANVFAVFEATYTDDGGAGGAGPLTGRAIEQLQPKRKQAEYFTATGRAPGGIGGGDPGVQRETTGDTAGGFQNIGFIEDGDWWSFAPTNLTDITSLRLPGRVRQHRRPRSRCAPARPTGTLLATATVPGDRRLADLHRRDRRPCRRTPRPRTAVLRRPATRSATPDGGGLFNVNWVDFLGRGVDRQRAAGGHRRRRRRPPAPRRSPSRSPARPPTPRATPR